jgi:hypothetical protein
LVKVDERGLSGLMSSSSMGREAGMKNVWKGLVLGGLTGVAAGIVLDALDRGAQKASALGERVAHQTPEVVGRLREVVSDAVAEGTSKLRDPEIADQVRGITDVTKKKAGELAAETKVKAGALAADAKERAGALADESKTKAGALADESKTKAGALAADAKEAMRSTRS